MIIQSMKLQLSYKSKIFLAIFLPGLLFSIILSLLFFYERNQDFHTQSHHQLTLSSDQFSAFYQESYLNIDGSHFKLERQLHAIIRNPNIISARVYTEDKKIVAEIGSKAPLTATNLILKKHFNVINSNNKTVAITPLYELSNDYDNSPTPSAWLVLERNNTNIKLQQYKLSSILIFLLIIFNAFYSLLSMRLAGKFSNPIKNFNNALDKAKEGQYDDIKNLHVPREYFSILMGMITIVERLENNRDDMQKGIDQATKDMRRNMDNMEEKSAQLYIANKEKSESNRLKTQFLANISHEVRTPLNAILGYTQLLQKDALNKQQRLYINTIEQSTNNLLAIIGDILDFSKIEAGKLNLENTDVNIRELIDDVYQILSANLLTNKKEIDLVPEVEKDVPEWVSGDAIRIRQILTNLIGNAIKFTPNGFVRTKVTVAKQSKKNITLSIEVIDSGIGIPDNKLPSLFKAFSQVNTSSSREFGGTGLGLVITKKLVEQMTGKIDVSSQHGIGSNFCFTLSLDTSTKKTPPYTVINKHVLVFEPSKNYTSYLNYFLTDIAVTATFCSSLEHLINRLISNNENVKIDAILLSVDGNDDNIVQCNEVATYAAKNHDIPCILMTQHPNKLNHHPNLQDLAIDVLLKPISNRRLYQSLQALNKKTRTIEDSNTDYKKDFINLNILAVDDNQINLQLVTHWLQPYGIKVTLAYSGQQALTLTSRENYDLIIMDIQMPEMDGMETTRHLRNQPNTKNTPIIALTAHALESEKKLILQCGMNAYLTKPVSETKLINVIQKWCFEQNTVQQNTTHKALNGIIDIEKALEIVDQQITIAKEMFVMFADSLESEKQLVEYHFKNTELAKMIQVVHRLHGASKYCGTPELTKQAGFLEQHLKELGLDGVDEVVDDFIKSIEDVLDARHLIVWPNDLD